MPKARKALTHRKGRRLPKARALIMARKSFESKCKKRVDAYLREDGLLSPEGSPATAHPPQTTSTPVTGGLQSISHNALDVGDMSAIPATTAPVVPKHQAAEQDHSYFKGCKKSAFHNSTTVPGMRFVEIEAIESSTHEQASCKKWRKERSTRLSASKFGRVLSLLPTTSVKSAVKEITNSMYPTAAMRRGSNLESRAKEKFEQLTGKTVSPAGLFIDRQYQYLAASPDGVISDCNSLVEIKCPEKANETADLREAITLGKVDSLFIDEKNDIVFSKVHEYYWQIQGQLNIAGRDQCYFVIHTDRWTEFITVARDEEIWKNFMVPKLSWFYFHALLPEIASPRYSIRDDVKDIREATMPWKEEYAPRPAREVRRKKKKTNAREKSETVKKQRPKTKRTKKT